MTDSVAEWLRAARLRSGLSQRALADRSGVHQPTIAAIETGRRRPTEQVLHALEEALATRPSDALRRHRTEVAEAISRRGGTDVRVIGSTARGTDTVGSDLDLMVTFPPGTTDLADLLDLVDELETLTGVRVDIVSGTPTGGVAEHAATEAVPL